MPLRRDEVASRYPSMRLNLVMAVPSQSDHRGASLRVPRAAYRLGQPQQSLECDTLPMASGDLGQRPHFYDEQVLRPNERCFTRCLASRLQDDNTKHTGLVKSTISFTKSSENGLVGTPLSKPIRTQ